MKLFNAMVGVFLFCFSNTLSSTTLNGRFTIIENDGIRLSVLLQVNTDTGIDDLGGTTIVFKFDTSVINFTDDPVRDIDYTYHNFCDGNYSTATITRPMENTIWVNIDLPYGNNNNGTIVTAWPEWTDMVTIHFSIIDPDGLANFSWLASSPFWGIYDADNYTTWYNGTFENFPTGVETNSEIPNSFKLEQNYPNPFNPATKIRFTVPNSASSQTGSKVLVKLKVYDILGNEVATLVDAEKTPGIYEVEFSSRTTGFNLASGIYIYRLEADDPSINSPKGQAGQVFIDTKKMVLLK